MEMGFERNNIYFFKDYEDKKEEEGSRKVKEEADSLKITKSASFPSLKNHLRPAHMTKNTILK